MWSDTVDNSAPTRHGTDDVEVVASESSLLDMKEQPYKVEQGSTQWNRVGALCTCHAFMVHNILETIWYFWGFWGTYAWA